MTWKKLISIQKNLIPIKMKGVKIEEIFCSKQINKKIAQFKLIQFFLEILQKYTYF